MGRKRSSSLSWWLTMFVMVLFTLTLVVIAVQTRSDRERIARLERRAVAKSISGQDTTHPMLAQADLVAKVDAFYAQAWVMLIAAIGVGGAIIGIVVPLVVQRLQRESFQSTAQDVEDRMKGKVTELDTKINQLANVAWAKTYHHSGLHWYFMAKQAGNNTEWRMSWRLYWFSLNSLVDALSHAWDPVTLAWAGYTANRLKEIADVRGRLENIPPEEAWQDEHKQILSRAEGLARIQDLPAGLRDSFTVTIGSLKQALEEAKHRKGN